ncbi:carbohydrate kinase family protein [Eggerthella guodeyinii]|uniref:Sugar kinase n=1 Tax=Eggerthella guodeyinii TaxID=2690837 RepID=A0A6N7RNG2_9ACTN|nr:PfkB family carbohydrate kinase [Eggerthella guodeyinii]MRX82431.1 sugar kinase [Eggerthella guodeyinii]
MVSSRPAVLAVGAIMVDMVCRVPRLPRSGEGIVVQESHATVGGCAFNSANVLRQLGAPHELFAPVGSGIFAGFVQRELDARGLAAPCFAERDSGGCVCFVEPGGERTMVTLPGIERFFERSWFQRVDASRFCCGFASGYEVEGTGGDAIIAFFEDHPSVQFYYAPGPRIEGVGADAEKTARINALHPVWHLNDQEALAYTGCATVDEAGFAVAAECGNAVVITAGAEGAHLFEGGRHVRVPALPVEVVDTIGAGDAHLGALTAARAAGRTWEDALALANRVAGAVCGVRGATLPDDVFAQRGIRL